MINLFGGAKETISILLEETEYKTGETVKGRLVVSTDKDSRVRSFRFVAEGKEETKVTVREQYTNYRDGQRYTDYRNVSYTSSDVFFSKDLFHNISESNSSFIIRDTDEGLIIRKGKLEIPFEISLPNNILSSYGGRNARVFYSVKATIDKKLRNDINEEINFDVAKNVQKEYPSSSISSSDRNNKGVCINLELESNTLHEGEKLKGVVIVGNVSSVNIRSVEIIAYATERATAYGRTETTIIDEFSQQLVNWKKNEPIPFEIMIPEGVSKSYHGRYSELFWEVKAKVDIPIGSDLNAITRIEII